MSFPPLVAAALELEYARLPRLVEPPRPPLRWGRDLSCVTDCTEYFAEVDGQTPLAIAQALARRLSTQRGGICGENYGLDLRTACNRGMAQQELGALQHHVMNECTKDERVARAQVAILLDLRERSLNVRVRIEPADPATTSFEFVLSVTSEQVLLEAIRGD